MSQIPLRETVPALPWERHSRESSRAFAAFQTYRDQPPAQRSIRRVAQTLCKSCTLVARWSVRDSWVDRVAAWDAEQDRVAQAVMTEARLALLRRLAAAGALMQAKGLSKVRTYVDRLDRDGNPIQLHAGQHYVDELSILEAVRLVEVGARLEQIGRGMREAGGATDEPVTVVTNPIVLALTTHPQRVGEAVAMMEQLAALLDAPGSQPMQLPPRRVGPDQHVDEGS